MKTIQDFLKQKGINCSKSSVHRFIHAKKRNKELVQARGGPLPEVTGGTAVTSGSKAAAIPVQQEKKPTFQTNLPRFDPDSDTEKLKEIFGTKKGDGK